MSVKYAIHIHQQNCALFYLSSQQEVTPNFLHCTLNRDQLEFIGTKTALKMLAKLTQAFSPIPHPFSFEYNRS